jgi:hypothetical protein
MEATVPLAEIYALQDPDPTVDGLIDDMARALIRAERSFEEFSVARDREGCEHVLRIGRFGEGAIRANLARARARALIQMACAILAGDAEPVAVVGSDA